MDKKEVNLLLHNLLAKANERGADLAEASLFRNTLTELTADAGEISLLRQSAANELSLKVIVNQKKGSSTGNQLDEPCIENLLDDAFLATENATPDEAEGVAEHDESGSYEHGQLELDRDQLFDATEHFIDETKKRHPKINIEQTVTQHVHGDYFYANSKGVQLSETKGFSYITAMFSATDGDKSSSFNYFVQALPKGLTDLFAFEEVRQQLSDAERSLDTISLEGEPIDTVIVAPECLGMLLELLADVYLTDSALIGKSTPWLNKIGEKVTSEKLTWTSDPTDERMLLNGRAVTDDGYVAKPNLIIEKGVLKNFILTRYGAKKTNKERSGNAGHAYIVEPGDIALKDLIASTKRGVLMNRFSGGNPSASGDFSGVLKNSFLIENGEVKSALSETMIAGNFSEILNNISGISREVFSNGTRVLPYMRFEGVHISGK